MELNTGRRHCRVSERPDQEGGGGRLHVPGLGSAGAVRHHPRVRDHQPGHDVTVHVSSLRTSSRTLYHD